MTPDLALALWARAAQAEIGIAIPTEDIRRLTIMLYKARQESRDLALQGIRVCQPAGGKEVWLVKETVEVMEA